MILRNRELNFLKIDALRGPALGWALFFIIAITSAFAYPFLFKGIQVFPVESFDNGTHALQWRPVNAVHAINLAVICMLCIYVIKIAPSHDTINLWLTGFAIAFIISLMCLALQRAIALGWLTDIKIITASLNPNYYQHPPDVIFGSYRRISWPFTEPSYASTWFAATYAAGLSLLVFGKRPWLGVSVILTSLFGILNSLGGAGLASILVFTMIILMLATYFIVAEKHFRRRQTSLRLMLFFGMLAAVISGLSILNKHKIFNQVSVSNIYSKVVLPRALASEQSGPIRLLSNREAIRMITETHGMGVGLGSNRASSFAFSMASCLGIIPTLLFFSLLIIQGVLILRSGLESTFNLVIAGGTAGAILGVIAGIPDLNWPAFWIWIIAGIGILNRTACTGSAPRQGGFTSA